MVFVFYILMELISEICELLKLNRYSVHNLTYSYVLITYLSIII